MSDLVKKTHIVPFINTGDVSEEWTQFKKSTAFTLNMNPQTVTRDFISEELPHTELDHYQPSLAQSLTMFKGEPDYQTVFDMLYDRATGEKAHRDILIVFYKETATYTPGEPEAEATTVYKAWKIDSLLQLSALDSVAGTIDFDLNFNTIKNGAVDMKTGKPKFIPGKFD